MPALRKLARPAIVGVLLIAVAVAGVMWFAGRGVFIRAEEVSWSERIRDVGAAAAYDEVRAFNEGRPAPDQHKLVHFFGEALYETLGIEGFQYCTDEYSYGCVHEFVGRAVADHGEEIIHSLNTECFERFGILMSQCQHGIGHGILSSLGYTLEDLGRALNLCHTLRYYDSVGGCNGGVFMEFNFQSMLGDDGELREPVGDLLYPCSHIDDEFHRACYFRQAQWLYSVYAEELPPERAFARVGEFCSALPDAAHVRACYLGIGDTVAFESDFIPDAIVTHCEQVNPSIPFNALCRSLAALRLRYLPEHRVHAPDVCIGLSGAHYDLCAAAAIHDMESVHDISRLLLEE